MVRPAPASPSASADVAAPFAPRTLLRDWVAAAAAIAFLYGLAYAVRIQPLQVPGYLLLVSFDALEVVLPEFPSSRAYDAAFAGYLALLAACAALGASAARVRGARTDWRPGTGAGLLVVGILALVLAAVVYLPVGSIVPVAIVLATGVVLALAGVLVVFGLDRLRVS